MTHDQREIHRKKRILEYAERIGNINKPLIFPGWIYFGPLRRELSIYYKCLGPLERRDWRLC